MEKRFSSFIALIVILLFCACATKSEVAPDVLRLEIQAEPVTLNPVFSSDAYGSQIANYLFDTMLDIDNDTLDFKPKLATSWEVSDDHKTYTFHLRQDARWHDGKPVTADDVLYSYQLITDPKLGPPQLQNYYKDIESVTKQGDDTVVFKYKQIYFHALSMCAFIPILPKHILENVSDVEHSDFSRHPIGNGPFVFERWDTNKKIVLTRNENYWGKKPDIRVLDYLIIPDKAMGMQILKKGLLDVYSLRVISWVKQTNSEKFNREFYKISYPGRSYSYLAWNLKSPFFSDKAVRHAMTMLMDLEKIRSKILYGLARSVTGPFFPFSSQSNNEIKALPYDPEAAKELLAKAGWRDNNGDGVLDKDGHKFEFTFLYPSSSALTERIATIMKENLERVGIEMKIERLEWSAFLDKLDKKEFDATSLAWTLPLENDPYQTWHSSQADLVGSSNFIYYKSAAADRLIESARVEFDEKKRNALYWKFQEILYDDQPYTFLYSGLNLMAVSKRFENVVVHPGGLDILEWKVKK